MNSAKVNKPILQALRGQKPDRYPVWFLRQAGRYLPEYREIRGNHTFLEVCHEPKLASQVTLQPLKRFDVDAAIIFSDILILPTAMGFDLTFDSGHGPVVTPPIRSADDIARVQQPHMPKLEHVAEAIQLTKSQLAPEQAMIGFAGAPFTVASYMIEGQGSRHYTEVKKLAFNDPKAFTMLLDKISQATTRYLLMQVEAGADAVMLFDSWAGNLAAADYRRLVFPSVEAIANDLAKKDVPFIYYPGAGSDLYEELSGLSVNGIAVDWRVPLATAERRLQQAGIQCTLQGNLDPQALVGDDHFVRTKVESILSEASRLTQPHIFNVGHGLLPHTPPPALETVISCLRQS